jgi:NADPH:quinone reductase-like Zn-dependent oxidoreductase
VSSGATAVGQYAVQLGKLADYKVVTTASQDNWSHLKSFGADETFDYKDKDAGKKINELTGDGLEYALDCICTDDSQAQIGQALSSKGGHLATILPSQPDKVGKAHKITETIVYTYLDGKDGGFGDWQIKAGKTDRADYVKWLEDSTALFEGGYIKPLPIHKAGGWNDVEKGFRAMQNNEIRGKKMVYTV